LVRHFFPYALRNKLWVSVGVFFSFTRNFKLTCCSSFCIKHDSGKLKTVYKKYYYWTLLQNNGAGLVHDWYEGAICKVRGLTLFLRVGTSWRCGDGLFFEVPPLPISALLITLHPLLENGVTVIIKEPFLGWRSNLSGASALRDWKVAMDALTEIRETPLERPPYSPDLAPCNFWAFPTMKKELRGQNRLLHSPPEACGKRSAARFREVGGAL
jgi:hypothetical protein